MHTLVAVVKVTVIPINCPHFFAEVFEEVFFDACIGESTTALIAIQFSLLPGGRGSLARGPQGVVFSKSFETKLECFFCDYVSVLTFVPCIKRDKFFEVVYVTLLICVF